MLTIEPFLTVFNFNDTLVYVHLHSLRNSLLDKLVF